MNEKIKKIVDNLIQFPKDMINMIEHPIKTLKTGAKNLNNNLNPKIIVTPVFAKNFENTYNSINARGFYDYCNHEQNGSTLFDIVKNVEKTTRNKDENEPKIRTIRKNPKVAKKLVLEFFEECLPNKAEEVKDIFNNEHPLFKDDNNVSYVIIKKKHFYRKSQHNISSSEKTKCLGLFSTMDGTINDWVALAHETAHALSSATSQYASGKFKHGNSDVYFDRDATAEIESHIIEELFSDYMLRRGKNPKEKYKFEQKDILALKAENNASLHFDADVIKDESEIIKCLPTPVTFEGLQKLEKDLKDKKNGRLLYTLRSMKYDSDMRSPHLMRYFVGRIVADEWIWAYRNSTEEKQKEMCKNFEKYLDKCSTFGLNSACEFLLGQNFEKVAQNFIERFNATKKESKNQESEENITAKK